MFDKKNYNLSTIQYTEKFQANCFLRYKRINDPRLCGCINLLIKVLEITNEMQFILAELKFILMIFYQYFLQRSF